MPKTTITSPHVFQPQGLPYAPATRAGDFVFACSTGVNAQGQFAAGDVKAQTQQTIDNIRALVEAAGGTLHDIVKCTVYVTNRADWEAMNAIYFANFHTDPPHRVSCIVSGLWSPECLVEIDATAYLGKAAS